MEIIPESMPATAPAPQYLPRFADGTVNLQELIRSMAEMLANEIMSAEADQLCDATGNSRNGYREGTVNSFAQIQPTVSTTAP